ncbi:MAG: PHB depolymerase family esterase [Deinococcales bacterium]
MTRTGIRWSRLPLLALAWVMAGVMGCSGSAAAADAPTRAPQAVTLPASGAVPGGRYLIDLPPGGGRGAPLLLALHGDASSPEAMRALTELSRAAAADGVAVVYPASDGVLWNDGRGAVPGFTKLTPRDDVAFLRAVVHDAVTRFDLDGSRVSVTGLGSGGSMALELGCRAPGLATALVVVNASLWDYQQKACAGASGGSSGGPSGPSLLMLHGDADSRQPWGGRDLSSEGVTAKELGVDAAVAAWASQLGCQAPVTAGALTLAHGCPAGTFAAAVRIRGEGGGWPRPGRSVTVAGRQETALDAADLGASKIAAAVAAGTRWQGLVPADPRLTGPAPGRSFDVYVPPGYDPSKATPLVLMLHGRGDSGYGMAALTRMNAVADRHGFVVAYPESFGDSWNYYERVPGVNPRSQVSDLTFFRRLVARLGLDLNLDPTRLYIAGFSNGGFMAERAACGVSDQFAAFAVVSASMLPEMVFDCDLAPTAPMVLMQGTADTNVPWTGIVVTQQGRQRYAALPAVQSVAFWTLRNGCVFLPDQQTLPDGSDGQTHVVRVRYGPCALGRDVTFYGIEGGGHNWPGGAALLPPPVAGAITNAIDASEVIWRFFADHPLDAARNRPVVPPADGGTP